MLVVACSLTLLLSHMYVPMHCLTWAVMMQDMNDYVCNGRSEPLVRNSDFRGTLMNNVRQQQMFHCLCDGWWLRRR